MKTARFAAVLALGVSALAASAASAGVTSATVTGDMSRRHLGAFSGIASYDSTTHKLTITLNNTSASGRGYLTGFAFGTESDCKALYADGDNPATRHRDEDAFDELAKAKGAKCKPFGKYLTGASLDGKWSPARKSRGIKAGGSHTFIFDVSGDSASSDDVIQLLSGPNPFKLVANFKGLKHGKSDQVGARLGAITSFIAVDPSIPGGDTTNNGGTNNNGNGGNGDNGSGGGTLPGGGGGGPVAVPLPPGAWTGMGTLGLLALARLRKRWADFV